MNQFLLEMKGPKLLINKAHSVLKNAYSPYSKFKVGAAILTKDGKIFSGCNVENISYGLTICAERVALFKAVSEGHTQFEAIAICSSSKKATFPCGACRQVLSEFGNMKVYLENDSKTHTLSDLLPNSFTKKQME